MRGRGVALGQKALSTRRWALARQHTAFQGRTQELALLQTCWARACQGMGQVVCLVGEAGIGKSRLAYECQQAFGAARWRSVQALSYGQAMPIMP
jgi:AAA ATPase domain